MIALQQHAPMQQDPHSCHDPSLEASSGFKHPCHRKPTIAVAAAAAGAAAGAATKAGGAAAAACGAGRRPAGSPGGSVIFETAVYYSTQLQRYMGTSPLRTPVQQAPVGAVDGCMLWSGGAHRATQPYHFLTCFSGSLRPVPRPLVLPGAVTLTRGPTKHFQRGQI